MAIKFLSAVDHGAYQLPTVDGSNGQVLTTDGNGNVTFQSVAASSNYYLSGASFNTGTGVLTLTVSGASNQTVDLDGRYALTGHAHNYDNYGSWNLKTNGVQRITVQSGGTLDLIAGSNVSLSYSAGGKVTITSTDTNTDTNDIDYIDSASFNTTTGVLSLTGVGNAGTSVDLDGRYLTGLPSSTGTLTTFTNAVTIESNTDGILNLKQTGLGGTAGTKDGGWNYIQFLDSQGDRQGYFGIDSSGHFQFNPEVSGAEVRINRPLRVSSNIIGTGTLSLTGAITASGYNDSNWNTAYGWGDHAGLYLGANAKAADSNLLDGIDSGSFLRSDTTDTATGALTFNGNVTFNGTVTQTDVNYGLYHSSEEDHYYFDDYNGSKHLSIFYKNAYSDILRYQSIDNLEYWDGSAWQDMSSQLSNVQNLLDGRKDTNWYVPSTYYKFRFTTNLATSWPTRSMIWLESSWTGSSYPGCTLTIEEDVSGTWTSRVEADFTSSNGVTNWGLAARADSALHTGNGGGSNSTRITVDFYGWSPSNPSYTTIPLQNIMITSQFSGSANTDYSSLLNYSKNLTAPAKLYISTVDSNTSSTSALVLNGTEVEKRTLGSNAFNSTTIPTNNNQLVNGAGYITNGNTGWSNTYGFITASSTDTLTNKTGNISMFTNDAGYLTSYTDTNDIDYVNAASFDTGTGVLTLSGVGNAGATVDLDGRYLTAHPNITAASSSNNSGRTYIQDITLDSNGHVTGITTATETVTNSNTTYTLTVGSAGSNSANINLNPNTGGTNTVQLSGGSNVTITENTTTDVITIAAANTNYYVDGLSFDTGTGILTASVNGATNPTVDLDGRYQLAGTYNTIIGTDADINTSGATVIDQLNMTDGVIQSHSTRTLSAADLGISQPNPPNLTALNIVGETIEIVFDESTTGGVDKYEVWSSVAGGSFGLIANIPTEDIAPTMTAVDAAFSVSGSQEYRIYAIKNGIYSASATGATTFNTPSLSVVNMSVINLNPAYYIQYDLPDSRFIDHIEIYMDVETASGSLSRTGATLVYSGNNTSYMYQIAASDLDKFHQFWVEVVAS